MRLQQVKAAPSNKFSAAEHCSSAAKFDKKMKKPELHPVLKKLLGHKTSESGKEILATWKKITASVCKPCWELKYCPFGTLVEQFPISPPEKAEEEEHSEYLKQCIKIGYLADESPLDEIQKEMFQKEVDEFASAEYPERLPEVIQLMSCRIFGHLCPVFFTAEPMTETKDTRRHGRYIPREIMLKVVRRDGQMCQVCHQYVPDNELDFDHVIPHSKGGPVTVDNLRVVHSSCNKSKSDNLDTILEPNPLSKQFLEEQKSKKNSRRE